MAATHEVTNQPPPLEEYNAFDLDPALAEAMRREGAGWAVERARSLGVAVGSARVIGWARDANRHRPEFRPVDRYGHRIDEVEYHPAYHELMAWGIGEGMHALCWDEKGKGGQVGRAGLYYLFNQAENGVACPITMTYAAVPMMAQQPEIAAEWMPRVLSRRYDRRNLPAERKTGATIGMALTEKQGGSDVRANTTRARPLGAGGPGGEYELTGHKWFCSAPMSDAFFTLAYTERGELSCFLVPRWRPDGTRNRILIQRLKEKVGNQSNASSEIEYAATWARMVGEEGRGVATIIRMVHHTRLDCAIGSAALIRHALVHALHHAAHRTAFQRRLIDQPLMRAVLADLALESEAAMALVLRLGRAFDGADESEQALARIGTAIGKYWVCKRTAPTVCEAMECLGGSGYVEDGPVARLYREAPLNGIWEGSANVICLDVARAMQREPRAVEALRAELAAARGADPRLDRRLDALDHALASPADFEANGRLLVERLATALQASLLVRHAPAAVADAFCAARLDGDAGGLAFGTATGKADHRKILERAWPAAIR
jgi:putative acyl-CoA dehydrogenase